MSNRSSEKALFAGTKHSTHLVPAPHIGGKKSHLPSQNPSALSGHGTVPTSPLGELSEEEKMLMIKSEFVEYVKEILTKTTSQVG